MTQREGWTVTCVGVKGYGLMGLGTMLDKVTRRAMVTVVRKQGDHQGVVVVDWSRRGL